MVFVTTIAAMNATRYAMMKSAKTVMSALNAETVNALIARKTTVTVSYVLIVKSAQRAANVCAALKEQVAKAKNANALTAASVIHAKAVTIAINPDAWVRFVKIAADVM